jgi:hypothetical protein
LNGPFNSDFGTKKTLQLHPEPNQSFNDHFQRPFPSQKLTPELLPEAITVFNDHLKFYHLPLCDVHLSRSNQVSMIISSRSRRRTRQYPSEAIMFSMITSRAAGEAPNIPDV